MYLDTKSCNTSSKCHMGQVKVVKITKERIPGAQ